MVWKRLRGEKRRGLFRRREGFSRELGNGLQPKKGKGRCLPWGRRRERRWKGESLNSWGKGASSSSLSLRKKKGIIRRKKSRILFFFSGQKCSPGGGGENWSSFASSVREEGGKNLSTTEGGGKIRTSLLIMGRIEFCWKERRPVNDLVKGRVG